MNLKYSFSWKSILAVLTHFLSAVRTYFSSARSLPDNTIEQPSSVRQPSRLSKLVYCRVRSALVSAPLSYSILNWPQLPTLKLLEMKFAFGQIIV